MMNEGRGMDLAVRTKRFAMEIKIEMMNAE